MREARAEVIPIGRYEDLRLVHEPPEGFGMDYAVPVALEFVADAVGRLGLYAARATLTAPPGQSGARGFGFPAHAGFRA